MRKRARELGINIRYFPTGKYNAITDVAGVKVGHSTVINGKSDPNVPHRAGKGPARTGVTAILPNENNIYMDRLIAGSFVLNGAGEVSGLTQVVEWGIMETPIILTNTLSVGTCSDAVVQYMVKQYPDMGVKQDVVIPLVGECDDSWLNDIGGQHIKHKHVFEAIENAKSGPVEEGNVGGGTGMITCDFKGGIGTSSRKIQLDIGKYTVGVLVMSNFGLMRDLRVDGLPVGQILAADYKDKLKRQNNYGSIITVIATDAPLSEIQLNRLCKKAALGIGRAGSHAAHGSGEIILAFSTANKVPRDTKNHTYKMNLLLDQAINPFYEAAIEATEEAILNALCMANTMTGINGNTSPALPLDRVEEIIKRRQQIMSEFIKK